MWILGQSQLLVWRRLGGGGHEQAAGCELEGNLENAKAAVLAEVRTAAGRTRGKERKGTDAVFAWWFLPFDDSPRRKTGGTADRKRDFIKKPGCVSIPGF